MNYKKGLFSILAIMLTLIVLVACDRDAQPEVARSTEFTEDVLQLQSEARYVFEQMFLPTVVYDSDSEEIIDLLSSQDVLGMEELLLDAWEHLTENFIEFSVMEDDLEDSADRDALGLGDEHIREVTVEMLNEDTPAFIISMLDIGKFLRSTYIAIVYHNNELQIYTLEQSDGFHMFCYVNLHSRGSFFDVENDRDAFIEAIISVLN